MESLNLTPPRPDGKVNEKLLYIGINEYYLRRLKGDIDILRGLDMNKEGIGVSVFKNLAELADAHLLPYQKELTKTTVIAFLEIKYNDIFNELKNMLKDVE